MAKKLNEMTTEELREYINAKLPAHVTCSSVDISAYGDGERHVKIYIGKPVLAEGELPGCFSMVLSDKDPLEPFVAEVLRMTK